MAAYKRATLEQLRQRMQGIAIDWEAMPQPPGGDHFPDRDWRVSRAVLRDGMTLDAASRLTEDSHWPITRERVRQIVHRTARRLGIDTSASAGSAP